MKAHRGVGFGVVLAVAVATLTACSPVIPIAYHVDGNTVDIAFCKSFEADRVEVDFSNYPPPFQGPKYTVALSIGTGPPTTFGRGVPISESMKDWQFTGADIPTDWERVDFSFYENGRFTGGEALFSRDVKSSDWTWQEGYNINRPTCSLDLE